MVLQDVEGDAQALDRGDARRVLAAAPVEERGLVTLAQAHDVDRVMRRILGQQAAAAGAQHGIYVEAGRLQRGASAYIVAPRVHGANSSSP